MSDNAAMTKVLGDLMKIDDPKCLKTIQSAAFNRGKDLRQRNAAVDTASWMKGDEVKMKPEHRNSKPYGATGKIKKINKIKMQVDFNGAVWNIPKAMLMKA